MNSSMPFCVEFLCVLGLLGCHRNAPPATSAAQPSATVATSASASSPSTRNSDADALLDQAVALGAKIDNDKRWMISRVLSLNEDDLIKGLSVFVKYSHGKFPSALSGHRMETEMNTITRELVQSGALKKNDQTTKELSNIVFAEMFYKKLLDENRDVRYHGAALSVADANRILISWKNDDGTFRVIGCDLHAQNVDADQLTRLEHS